MSLLVLHLELPCNPTDVQCVLIRRCWSYLFGCVHSIAVAIAHYAIVWLNAGRVLSSEAEIFFNHVDYILVSIRSQ